MFLSCVVQCLMFFLISYLGLLWRHLLMNLEMSLCVAHQKLLGCGGRHMVSHLCNKPQSGFGSLIDCIKGGLS